MALIVIERRTGLSSAEAWRRLTTWERHTASVPFTRIEMGTLPPSGLGTVFTARTRLGRIGFDDPMRVTVWAPPEEESGAGFCRLEKTGRIVTGWAEIEVSAAGSGSRVRWREELRVLRIPRLLDPVTAGAGRLVFGRAVDALLAA